jgi:prophage regulatory protein
MKKSTPVALSHINVTEGGVTLHISMDSISALFHAIKLKVREDDLRSESLMQVSSPEADKRKTDRLLVSIRDAAIALGVSRATIYKLLKIGKLKGVRLGGRSMIPTQVLRGYAESLSDYALVMPTEGAVSPSSPRKIQQGDEKLKFKAVMTRTGLSRQQLFTRRSEGTFPPGVTLSRGVLGWDQSDVDDWIADPTNYRAKP